MSSNAILLTRLLVASFALTAALTANGQQYRWVDEKGRVQYTGTPPPAGTKDVQKKNLDAGPAGSAAEPYALQVAMKKAPVKLYSSPDCGEGCADARKLLNERGIPFSESTITSPAQLAELKSLSGGTVVPVILVGGAVVKGFEAGSFHRALDFAGYPKQGLLRPRNQAAPAPPKPAATTPAAAAGTPAVEPANAVK